MVTEAQRRLPMGTEVQTSGGAHFRVWGPLCQNVQVVVEGGSLNSTDPKGNFDLLRETNGYFSGFVTDVGNGTLYRYRLGGRTEALKNAYTTARSWPGIYGYGYPRPFQQQIRGILKNWEIYS